MPPRWGGNSGLITRQGKGPILGLSRRVDTSFCTHEYLMSVFICWCAFQCTHFSQQSNNHSGRTCSLSSPALYNDCPQSSQCSLVRCLSLPNFSVCAPSSCLTGRALTAEGHAETSAYRERVIQVGGRRALPAGNASICWGGGPRKTLGTGGALNELAHARQHCQLYQMHVSLLLAPRPSPDLLSPEPF